MTEVVALAYVFAAGFGLIFGSFFNVVIYRLPPGESLGHRSRCPGCGGTIRWYDNIPLVSFAILKGRCRHCGGRISWRYPVVEATTAVLFVLVYWWSRTAVITYLAGSAGVRYTKTPLIIPELFIGLLMVSVLIIASGTDIDHGIIPNVLSYTGIVLMAALVTGLALYRRHPWWIAQSFGAAAAGAGFLLAASLLYGHFRLRLSEEHDEKKPEGSGSVEGDCEELAGDGPPGEPAVAEGPDEEELPPLGMGIGDIKMFFFIGLAVGYFHWYMILLVIFLASLFGAVGALIMRKGGRERFAFMPFIAAGGILTLLVGQQLIDLYLKVLT